MTTSVRESGAGAGGVVLGTMGGDRPCVRCGFNLHGQPIVREGHYQMLIARCPECGEVAALQEYPALGRWAGRIAGVVAGLWLLLILGLGVGSAGIVYGCVEQTATDVLMPAGLRLATEYRVFARENLDTRVVDEAQRAQWLQWWENNPVENYPVVGQEFLSDPAGKALVASIGLWDGTDWTRARSGGWLALACVCLGMLWSVLCPQTRWRGRLMVALLICLGAGGFWLWGVARATTPAWGGQDWGPTVAFRSLGGALVAVGLAASWVVLVVGQLLGRPLVRWLVVLLLPARMRAGLGFLWTMHGKAVPGVRGGRLSEGAAVGRQR